MIGEVSGQCQYIGNGLEAEYLADGLKINKRKPCESCSRRVVLVRSIEKRAPSSPNATPSRS